MGGYGSSTRAPAKAPSAAASARAGPDDKPGVKIYMRVDDLETYLDRAEKLGGRRLVPPTDLPGDFGTLRDLRRPGRQPGRPVGLTEAAMSGEPGDDRMRRRPTRRYARSPSPAAAPSCGSSRSDELAAGEIAAAFDVTRTAVSQHLTVLKNAGLLAERRTAPAALPGPAGGAGRTARVPGRHVGLLARPRPPAGRGRTGTDRRPGGGVPDDGGPAARAARAPASMGRKRRAVSSAGDDHDGQVSRRRSVVPLRRPPVRQSTLVRSDRRTRSTRSCARSASGGR